MITPEVIKFQNEIATPLYAYVYSADRENRQVRAYVAGKVTGLPHDEVVQKFAAATAVLNHMGYEAINPVAGTSHLSPERTPWEVYMRITMVMMFTCDVVVALPDAINSKGARIEMEAAIALGIPVMSYADVVNQMKGGSHELAAN